MKPEEQARLSALNRKEWCGSSLIKELYGLECDDDSWMGVWRSWARGRQQELVKRDKKELFYNRYRIETFFQKAQVLPTKIAALRLGMYQDQLVEILRKMGDKGDFVKDPFIASAGENLIDEEQIRKFASFFENLQFTIFGDHDDFCKQLHRTIKDYLEVEIKPAKCVTAQRLGESDYAYNIDMITLEPVGVRYEVWLDMHKPLNLKPDTCSLLFYAENELHLRPLLFPGSEPPIPEQLRAA